jgi:hypothetical protein
MNSKGKLPYKDYVPQHVDYRSIVYPQYAIVIFYTDDNFDYDYFKKIR